jgi:hypothetical protein
MTAPPYLSRALKGGFALADPEYPAVRCMGAPSSLDTRAAVPYGGPNR